MKRTLFTVAAVTFIASPSLFAMEDSLQEHLRMEQKLQQQTQMRLQDGSGSQNQYKYQNKYQYKGTNPSMFNMGSIGGVRSGGRR